MKRIMLGLLMMLSLACRPATLAEKVQSSLVKINALVEVQTMFGSQEVQSVCTGFVVKKDIVLTAAHCVGPDLFGDGKPATLLQSDKYYDLAVVRVSTTKPALKFDSGKPYQGESLMAVGYGFGWSCPIVSTLPVSIPSQAPNDALPRGIIMQGDLVHGMSGGPIVNQDGKVVAISQQTHEGTSYGVGVLMMRVFLFDAGVEVGD